MGLLFAFALLRAEAERSRCSADPNRVCFDYPIYLRYGTWQGIDLNWPGLIPQAIFDLLPSYMSRQRVSLNGLRIAGVVLCAAVFW